MVLMPAPAHRWVRQKRSHATKRIEKTLHVILDLFFDPLQPDAKVECLLASAKKSDGSASGEGER